MNTVFLGIHIYIYTWRIQQLALKNDVLIIIAGSHLPQAPEEDSVRTFVKLHT